LISQSEALKLSKIQDAGVRFVKDTELVDMTNMGGKISSLQFSMLNKDE